MGTEADGENYGISYEGGLRSTHNTRQVFLDNFGFEAGDRFTYTYNFAAFWLWDIRIEAIEPLSTQITRCFGGSGCQSEETTAFLGQGLSGGVQGFDIDTVCPGVIYCRFSGGLARAKVLEPVLLTLGQ